MIRSYLWYTLFIWYHFLFIRLFLFILCVYCYIIILNIVLLIQHTFLIIGLFVSCVLLYIICLFFFEFDQYVEIKISMQNISWFIYYHLYLFFDLLIEFHFLITIICLYLFFIYSLNLTFRSSEYKDTKIHIFHSFLYGDKLVSDNGVDLTIFIFRFS